MQFTKSEALSVPSTPPHRVFASYSRKDARPVHELVRLLRMTGAPVFLDTDSIEAGERWRSALEAALVAADLVAVFWTRAAAESAEVAREYRRAMEMSKPVVPVLLDDAPLPTELAEFQGVALTDLFSPHDQLFDPQLHVQELVRRFTAVIER